MNYGLLGDNAFHVRNRRRFLAGSPLAWINTERAPGMLDLSGRGNHPTLSSAPAVEVGTGGRRVWRFEGAQYITFPNVFSALTECEVFIVVKADGVATHDRLWNFQAVFGNGDTRYPFVTDGAIYDDFGTDARKSTGVPASSPVDDYIIYNVTTKANGWTSRINGTQHFTTATNTVGFNATCQLGRASAAAWFFGNVGDFIAFDHELTAGERASFVADLTREFKIV